MKGIGPRERRPRLLGPSSAGAYHLPWRRLKPQAMADPVYDRIDLITLTVAIVLAAAIMLLAFHLVPDLADLMPPTFSGAR